MESNKKEDGAVFNQITQEPVQVEVSRTRFYVLLLYCVFTMEQCANWNTYGPVAASAKVSFVLVANSAASFGCNCRRCSAGRTPVLPP